MNSRFGTSELRLNLLDASLPFEYPVNVYSDVFDPRTAQSYEDLARLGEKGAWEDVLQLLEERQGLINTCRLPKRGEETVEGDQLWTPLHRAAASSEATAETVSALLGFGALKSLCTGSGETAWDIASRLRRPQEILDLVEVPRAVTANRECIRRMEATAHSIIKDRAGDLLSENGMALPQVQILWEVSNQCGESLMVPVLGMRGGFSLDLDLEDEDGSGEVAKLYMVSWSRAEDSEEVRHVIDSTGKARDISDVLAELREELGQEVEGK